MNAYRVTIDGGAYDVLGRENAAYMVRGALLAGAKKVEARPVNLDDDMGPSP